MWKVIRTAAFVGTAALAGCDGNAGSSGTSAPDAVPAANVQKATEETVAEVKPAGRGPMLTFTEKVHDLGTIWDVEDQAFEFTFTNTGDETLLIDEVKASCGCTTPTLKKKDYAPGESGALGIAFDPKGHGDQSKYLTVTSNAVNEPSVKLFIKSFIKEFVSVDPHIVQFKNVRVGEPHVQIVKLTSVDPNIEITGVVPRGQHVQARLLGGAAGPAPANSTNLGGPFSIEITALPTAPWGQTYGSVDVMTRGRVTPASPTIDHKATISVNIVAMGDVIVDPMPIQVGLVSPGGMIDKTVTLTSRNNIPFHVVSAEFRNCPVNALRAELQPLPGGAAGYSLTVKGPAGDYVGIMRGELRIITDLPGDVPIDIPLRGAVRNVDAK